MPAFLRNVLGFSPPPMGYKPYDGIITRSCKDGFRRDPRTSRLWCILQLYCKNRASISFDEKIDLQADVFFFFFQIQERKVTVPNSEAAPLTRDMYAQEEARSISPVGRSVPPVHYRPSPGKCFLGPRCMCRVACQDIISAGRERAASKVMLTVVQCDRKQSSHRE